MAIHHFHRISIFPASRSCCWMDFNFVLMWRRAGMLSMPGISLSVADSRHYGFRPSSPKFFANQVAQLR